MFRKSKVIKVFLIALTVFILGASSPIPQEAVAAKTTYVYVATKSGTKYHKTKKCRTLKRSKKIKKLTLKNAKKSGYKACKVCRPKK